MDKNDLINLLGMKLHGLGGYFTETYQSKIWAHADQVGAKRCSMSSIYYLLTDDQPICHFHRNKSDIVHFFHGGEPITYFTIDQKGVLEKFVLGLDIVKGHHPQMLVKGGVWKAAVLENGKYGLLSEAVSPGFDYADEQLADATHFKQAFPELWNNIKTRSIIAGLIAI